MQTYSREFSASKSSSEDIWTKLALYWRRREETSSCGRWIGQVLTPDARKLRQSRVRQSRNITLLPNITVPAAHRAPPALRNSQKTIHPSFSMSYLTVARCILVWIVCFTVFHLLQQIALSLEPTPPLFSSLSRPGPRLPAGGRDGLTSWIYNAKGETLSVNMQVCESISLDFLEFLLKFVSIDDVPAEENSDCLNFMNRGWRKRFTL